VFLPDPAWDPKIQVMVEQSPSDDAVLRPAVEVRGRRCTWFERGIVGVVCALVVGIYAYTAHWGPFGLSAPRKEWDDYYSSLVQGFWTGQLSLKKEVPPGLAQLADPYDPSAHAPYYHQVGDLSYYKGKLYLYFGVTPAVMLFWPYVALTNHSLSQKDAVVVFCLIGFLASAGLLWALWRRYFAEVNVTVVAAGTLALGLATLVPLMLSQCGVWEVPISCGYALTMLALAAIWKALHESRKRSGWLAAASLAYGLAVGARPSLLFGAVILLVPAVQAWRERRKLWAPLLAGTVPIMLIGLGLMLYNRLRFDNPLEFGWHYELTVERQLAGHPFSLRYFWFNFRVCFLELARWSGRFPFVHDITVPALPAGHGRVEQPFGVLTNIPLVWLALAVPLAWRGQSTESRSILRRFVMAIGMFFGVCTLTLCLFFAVCTRYEVEFLPVLVLLSVIGVLSVERMLTHRPVWRRVARWGWSLLLSFSVAFNLLAGVRRSAEVHYDIGIRLEQQGKMQEAIEQYERTLRLNPDHAEAHNDLAAALIGRGKLQEARVHCEQALRLKPEYAEAHNNLAVVLVQLGKRPEAMEHWGQALRINPDYADAHCNLGLALDQQGRTPEAIQHYEQALRLKPDFVKAHYNLGNALLQTGRVEEAIRHYELTLQLRPDHAEAHNNLGLALVQLGRTEEAVEHWEQALRLKPDFAMAHYNLGGALEQAGKVPEAIQHYERALRIQPDFAEARNALARLEAGQ